MIINSLTILLLVGAHQCYGLPTDIGDANLHKDDGETKSGTGTRPTSDEFVEEVKKSIPHWPMSVKSKYVSVIPEQLPELEVDPREPEKNQLIQTRSTKILPPASPDLDTPDYSIPYNRGKTISSNPEDTTFRFPELPPPMDSKIQEFRESSHEYEDSEEETLGPRALGAENLPSQGLQSEDAFLNNIPAIEETTNSIEIPKEVIKREEKTAAGNVQTGLNVDPKLPAIDQNGVSETQILSNDVETGLNANQKLSGDVQAALSEAQKVPEKVIQAGLNETPKLPANIPTGLNNVQKVPENVQTSLTEAEKLPSTAQTEINDKGQNLPEATQAVSGGKVPSNDVQVEPETGIIKPGIQDAATQTDLTNPEVNGGISGQNSKPDPNTEDLDEDEDDDDEDAFSPTPALLMKIMRLAGIPPGRCSLVIVSRRPITSFQTQLQPQPQPQSQSTYPGSRNFFEPFRPVQSPSFIPSRFFAQPQFPANPFFNPMPSYNQRPNPVNPFSLLFRK